MYLLSVISLIESVFSVFSMTVEKERKACYSKRKGNRTENYGMDYAIGIDIGSTCAKTAVLAADGSFALLSARPTGWSSVDTAESIRAELEAAHFSPEACPCVATGYGRIAVPYAGKSVTEITCHARGACFLHGRDDLLVIDIGGQDTKVIGVSGGAVQDFLMNDKCSAGTGRFLEIMANRLGMRPE